MKRLVRKAFGKTVYHGTSFEGFKGIVQDGMLYPQASDGAYKLVEDKVDSSHYDGYSFVTSDIKQALWYAENVPSNDKNDFTRPLVVLELDIDPSILQPDTESNEQKDSKFMGGVSTEYVRNVHFFKSDTKQEVFSSTLSNWKEEYEEHAEEFENEREFALDFGLNPYIFEDGSLDDNGNLTPEADLTDDFYIGEVQGAEGFFDLMEFDYMDENERENFKLPNGKYGLELPSEFEDYPVTAKDLQYVREILKNPAYSSEWSDPNGIWLGNGNLVFDIEGNYIIVVEQQK